MTTAIEVDAASDHALLARIRAGDAAALSTLYRRHSAAVFRFACLHASTRDAAADATQETFLWLATHGAATFDSEKSSLAAFLCGVVRNHTLRIRALDARYISGSGSVGEDDERGESAGTDDGNGDAFDDALAHLINRERADALMQALATLASEHREVIALIEFEEFSYADAALIIGVPIGTVRSRLSRAKEALKLRVMELFPTQQRISA